MKKIEKSQQLVEETHCCTSKKEASSLTKQKQEKISKMFGANNYKCIFAPALKKALRSLTAIKRQKISDTI